eukprot:GEMP01041656.1.p1 GENE.GEMP01041656.1~~GEMP01041656.1.p1  ORF type:complete len:377 (+),score=42.29 GEMP01041656.1:24-1133(+)
MGRVRLGNALKNVLKKKGVCASLFLAVTGYVFVVSSLTLPWAQVDINMSYPVVSFDIYLHSLKVSQRTGFYEFIKSVVKNHETLKDALESLTGMLSIGHTRNLICGVITDGLVFAWLDVLCQELAAEEHAGIAVIIIVTIATSLEVVACGLLCYHAFVRPRRSLRKKCLVLFSVSPSMLVVAVVLYAFANGLFLSYDLAYGIDIDIEQGPGLEMMFPGMMLLFVIPCLFQFWEMRLEEALEDVWRFQKEEMRGQLEGAKADHRKSFLESSKRVAGRELVLSESEQNALYSASSLYPLSLETADDVYSIGYRPRAPSATRHLWPEYAKQQPITPAHAVLNGMACQAYPHAVYSRTNVGPQHHTPLVVRCD